MFERDEHFPVAQRSPMRARATVFKARRNDRLSHYRSVVRLGANLDRFSNSLRVKKKRSFTSQAEERPLRSPIGCRSISQPGTVI